MVSPEIPPRSGGLNLAIGGQNLREAINELHTLEARPDLLLVYSGHNEYYRNMQEVASTGTSPFAVFDRSLARSPTFSLVYRQLSQRPAFYSMKFGCAEFVARHIATPDVYERRIIRFLRQLQQLAGFCRDEQIATIWFVPAASESGWDPNRSIPDGSPSDAVKRPIEQTHSRARKREAAEDWQAAAALYRQILNGHSGFSEAHYRLGECLMKLDQSQSAAGHFRKALDFDGHPIRANADYRDAVRKVAQANEITLIDAGDILRRQTEHGILDRSMFHDNVHPTLRAFFLLGIAATHELNAEPFTIRFGTPAELPTADFGESITDAGINREDLALAYRRVAFGVRWMTRWRFDPSQRERMADEFERLSRRLESADMQPGEFGSESLSSESIETDEFTPGQTGKS